MKHFNKLIFILITFVSITGCKKYFNINADPASPQNADLAAILPPVLANSIFHHAVEGTNAALLIQNFTGSTGATLQDQHGGNAGGASTLSFWRTFYVTIGTSVNLIIDKGIAEENWDYVGVGYAIKAWGFQQATDYFGELPFRQAWQPNRASFEYDTQEAIYKGIDSLLRTSLSYLTRTDGKVSASSLSRGDLVYKGDRSKWIKFVHGLFARHYNRYTNKNIFLSEGYADSVIKYVDLSFASNADNFQVLFPATKNDDTNPFGPARGNFNTIKKSRFITHLLDGTTFLTPSGGPTPAAVPPGNRDPRLRSMLTISADTSTPSANMSPHNGGYRYNVLATSGGGDFETDFRKRVSVVYADSTPTNTGGAIFAKAGKYVFQNSAPGTLMGYHELQFIKAEAAHRKGNKSLAYTAYINGINAHFDFVNTYSTLSGNTPPITAAQRTQYFATPAVKSTSNALTLTDIMLQKYIGDWAWNPYESWADVRRYHYFDIDPETGDQVYRTFVIPFYSLNNLGPKPAYRFLPTTFSEFDWNEQEIRKIGGFNQDYHTYEMWFTQP
ncbi:MAG: SusD/RagB family nutrient-binding outer membrane lipoprotein [Chitinophagaceae bacterium]